MNEPAKSHRTAEDASPKTPNFSASFALQWHVQGNPNMFAVSV